MTPQQLTQARGNMIASLQAANKLGIWLAAIFMMDPVRPGQIGCGLAYENFPIEAITRGQPVENLPSINQAIMIRLKQCGAKIISGTTQQSGLVVSSDNGQGGKIIDPTKM